MVNNVDEAMLSSPDPLNDSPTYSSPIKSRLHNRKSLPLGGSSPRKQMFELDVGDKASPQKIRVTVEAEAFNQENTSSMPCAKAKAKAIRHQGGPSLRRNERTITTTVPVKGLSDSESDTAESPVQTPKRGRGRPRKAGGTPVPSRPRTRTVTPGAKPGRRQRRKLGELIDDDEDDWDFQISAGVEVGRGKGRSRSRSFKGNPNKSTPASESFESPQRPLSSTARKSSKGRRKTVAPEEVVILDENGSGSSDGGPNSDRELSIDGRRVLAKTSGNSKHSHLALSVSRSEYASEGRHDESAVLNIRSLPQPKRQSYVTNLQRSQSRAEEHSPMIAQDTELSQTSASRDPSPSPHEEDDYDGRVDYEIDELEEFDTVLESEGFSMISVDSVPSLREHLSSPATDDRSALVPTPTSLHTAVRSPSIVVDSAQSTSRRAVFQSLSNPQVSSVRASFVYQADDSFSSIPPEVLEAATPRRPLPKNRLISLRTQDERKVDDSFSSIPAEILDAATPARHRNKGVRSGDSFLSQERSGLMDSMTRTATERSVKPSAKERASSRMITPEETPPAMATASGSSIQENCLKVSGDEGQPSVRNDGRPDEVSMEGSSTIMRSSPPTVLSEHHSRSTETCNDRSVYPEVIETPSMMFSSPSLPPPLQQAFTRNTKPTPQSGSSNTPRNGFLPIVQAGQALQGITIPFLGSRDRSQSLGSPFKSPSAPRRPNSSPQESANSNHPKEVAEQAGRRASATDGMFGVFSSATRRDMRSSYMAGARFANVTERVIVFNEDPFRQTGPIQLRSPSPENKSQYNLALPAPKVHHSGSALKSSPENLQSVTSDWQTKVRSPKDLPSPEATNSVTSVGEDDPEPDLWQIAAVAAPPEEQRQKETWSHDKTVVSQLMESSQASRVMVNISDKVDTAVTDQYGGDVAPDVGLGPEEDIWMVEAKNSSSLLEEQSPEVTTGLLHAEKPKRSKLPSPWRQNSRRLVYSDELASSSLSPKSPGKTSREEQQAVVLRPVPADSDDQLAPRRRSSREEANLSILESKTRKLEFIPKSSGRLNGVNAIPQRISPRVTEVKQVACQIQSESGGSSKLSMLQPIPQKLNFAPRVRSRDSGHLNLSVLLGSSPAKVPPTPSAIVNDNRALDCRALKEVLALPSSAALAVIPGASLEEDSCTWDTTDIIEGSMFQPAPQEASHSELSTESWESSADEEIVSPPVPANQSILAEPSETLPSASPRKSCLRTLLPSNPSPSKTVVFTGISSSPSVVTTSSTSSPITTPTPLPPSSQPLQKRSVAPAAPLSPTTWSKAHWKLLNRIYQDAKRAPATPRGACTSALLGKVVRAQGEKLVLTETLLDVVACFRDEVPGWDEGVVARRLFGLVVDEERKAGLRKAKVERQE